MSKFLNKNELSPEMVEISEKWEKYNEEVRIKELKFRKSLFKFTISMIGFSIIVIIYLILK